MVNTKKSPPPPLYIIVPNDFKLGDKLYLEGMDFVSVQDVRFRASTRDSRLVNFSSPTKLERVEGLVYRVVRTFKRASK